MSRIKKYSEEHRFFREALLSGNEEKIRYHLGRIHILAQSNIFLHLLAHFLMFGCALYFKDFKESFAQIVRLLVTIPGHILGKVPVGNTGWSSVGLLETMPIPEDLKSVVTGVRK
jgi:hypothetical protein